MSIGISKITDKIESPCNLLGRDWQSAKYVVSNFVSIYECISYVKAMFNTITAQDSYSPPPPVRLIV